eukprot:3001114-Prorocentrum_lima.AAC.1
MPVSRGEPHGPVQRAHGRERTLPPRGGGRPGREPAADDQGAAGEDVRQRDRARGGAGVRALPGAQERRHHRGVL